MKKKWIFLIILALVAFISIPKIKVAQAGSITCTGDKTQICAKLKTDSGTLTMYGDKGVYEFKKAEE